MDTFTVSFFGHRAVGNMFAVEERLEAIVREIITKSDYTEFLVGREGEFDVLAASVIRRTKRELDYGNSALVLVLPYITAEYQDNKESFHNYFDEVEICAEAEAAHFKAAITIRNKSMVDRSRLVVCNVEREKGGAFGAMKYAWKMKKEIINIADIMP